MLNFEKFINNELMENQWVSTSTTNVPPDNTQSNTNPNPKTTTEVQTGNKIYQDPGKPPVKQPAVPPVVPPAVPPVVPPVVPPNQDILSLKLSKFNKNQPVKIITQYDKNIEAIIRIDSANKKYFQLKRSSIPDIQALFGNDDNSGNNSGNSGDNTNLSKVAAIPTNESSIKLSDKITNFLNANKIICFKAIKMKNKNEYKLNFYNLIKPEMLLEYSPIISIKDIISTQ